MAASPTFCDTCGAANQPNHAFCFSCGRPLSASGVAASSLTGLLSANKLLKQRYRILHAVGKGGMGAVYAAEDTQLGNRLVAVKEMSQSGLSPQETMEAADNFKQEAHMLARLQHPGLPSIHDHFAEGGRWYLVMSFIQGETLQDYLDKKGGKVPMLEALQIGIELCNVLDYLHTYKPPIIFRDLKPSNIMRTPQGQIYLIDFGIARHFKPGQAKDTANYGSAGYSAPEQYGRSQTTQCSDIYSLGATLYQMLTGYNPSSTPFLFPSLQGKGFPAELVAFIEKMLDMDESKRPASMLVVKQELQRVVGSASLPPTVLQPTPIPPRNVYTPPPPPIYTPPPQPVMQGRVLQQAQAIRPAVGTSRGSIWRFGGRQFVAAIIGVVLCAAISVWIDRSLLDIVWSRFNVGDVPYNIGPNLILDSVIVALALFCGAVFGPWTGLLVGGVGTLVGGSIAYNVANYGEFRDILPYIWNWDVGIAIIGFIAGLTLARTRGRLSRAVYVMSALAIVVGIAFYDYAYIFIYHLSVGEATTYFLLDALLIGVISLVLLAILLRIYRAVTKGRVSP